MGYRELQPIKITECAYADDVASNHQLQHNLNIWKETLEKYKMKINTKKTKIMTTAEERNDINIQLNGDKLEHVTNFKYLGVIINGK